MASYRWNVKVYNVVTNGLHSEFKVTAPDEEYARHAAAKKFGNTNSEELSSEFYRVAVTQLDELPDSSAGDPVPDDVPETVPETVAASEPDVESNADKAARLRAEADALEAEGKPND